MENSDRKMKNVVTLFLRDKKTWVKHTIKHFFATRRANNKQTEQNTEWMLGMI